jgi:hypothetical protein
VEIQQARRVLHRSLYRTAPLFVAWLQFEKIIQAFCGKKSVDPGQVC